MKRNIDLRMLTTLAVLIALSIVLMMFIRFPMFTTFLEYEPMDVPILIAGFAYGPVAGLAVTLISSLIQGITVSSAAGGWVGILMHFIASGTLVTVASLIYRKNHSIKGAIIGLVAGTLSMAAIMIPANLIIDPPFYFMTVDQVTAMILPIIIPFNLVKAGINSLVTFLIYKPLRNYVIIDKRPGEKRKNNA